MLVSAQLSLSIIYYRFGCGGILLNINHYRDKIYLGWEKYNVIHWRKCIHLRYEVLMLIKVVSLWLHTLVFLPEKLPL